jgi:hypothetical protein
MFRSIYFFRYSVEYLGHNFKIDRRDVLQLLGERSVQSLLAEFISPNIWIEQASELLTVWAVQIFQLIHRQLVGASLDRAKYLPVSGFWRKSISNYGFK